MNPSRLARRIVAGAAGLVIGAAATLALASPASAHHPVIKGEGICDTTTGEFVITWIVTSSGFAGTVTEVTANPDTEVTGIVVGAALPAKGTGELVGEQRVPGDTTYASLTVTVEFPDGTEPRSGMVRLSGDCKEDGGGGGEEPLGPIGASLSTCDLLVFVIDNSEGTAEAALTFTPNETATHGHAAGFSLVFNGNGEVEGVEATEDAGIETVVGEADSENPVMLTFPAGADPHAHAFEAFDGLEVSVTLELDGEPAELEDNLVAWEEPEDCAEDGDGGAGGELPTTGSATTLIAGGAVALLLLGGGLYLVARRRRVTFTA